MNKSLPLLIGMLFSILSFGQIPTINLSSEFKFNNGSIINTAASGISFSQTGSALTQIANRAGGVDRAINLNGDYLQRANDATNNISVSYWVKTSTNDANKRVIIDQTERTSDTENSTHTGWYTYLQNGKIGITGNFQWYHSSNTAAGNTGYMGYQHLLSSATLNDGTWHHVGVTMRARWYNWFNAPYGRTDRVVECQYILYVDGVQDGVLTQRQNLGNAPSPAMRRFTNSSNMAITVGDIRTGNSASTFEEGFDDFRYYRQVINAAEMAQLAAETACAGSTSVTAIAQDITIQLDVNGNALISAADVNNGSETSCGEAANVSIDKTFFTCADLGTNNVTLTSDDGEGNTNTTVAIVTVEPLITVATVYNVPIELDASGNATLAAADLDNSSTSSCAGPLTLSVDKSSFTCADLGSQSVILTVADANGNMSSATGLVYVRDVTPPVVVTQDISVVLGANGTASITTAQIDNGSTDNCGSLTLSLSKSLFTCDDLGANTVTLTATASGSGSAATLIATETATVTVTSSIIDQTVTSASSTFCPDGSPSASTTISTGSSETGKKYYLRKSTDNSTVDGPIPGTGSGLTFNTGTLSETTKFNVFAIPDPVAAIGTALEFDGINDKVQTTYSLPTTSTLTIEAMFYPNSSKFARIISNYRGSNGLAPGEFDIDNADLGGGVGRGLRFILADVNGTPHLYGVPNALTLNAWNHIAVTFDQGVIKLFVNGIQVGTSTAPFSSIPANNKGVALGEDRIEGYPEYYDGKMDEVRFWNTVRTPAEIVANKDKCLLGNETGLEAYFNFEDASGTTLTESVSGKNGTLLNMDNADWVSGTTLTCASGCGSQMATEVTIGDNVAPTAVAKNITVQYASNGEASVVASDLNDGSTDNCTSTANLVYSLDKASFTCDDLGVNAVILSVTDEGGNTATASATVTVTSSVTSETVAIESNNICEGEATIVTIPNSVVGVNYYLRNDANDATIGAVVEGTGSAIDFNTGALNANTTFNVYGKEVATASANQALDFDGTNDYVETGVNAAFNYGTAYTMESWVKTPLPGNTAQRPIFSIGNSATSEIEFYIQAGTNKLVITHDRGQPVTYNAYRSTIPPNNVWFHLAVTYDATGLKVYYNGVQQGVDILQLNSPMTVSGANTVKIGKITNTAFGTNGAQLLGQLDDVRLWSVARSGAEINASKDNCLTGSETGLEAYYNFDETSGTVATDLANGNNGTLTNMDPATDRIASTTGITCITPICGVEMSNTVTVSTDDTSNPTVITRTLTAALGNNTSVSITPAQIDNGSMDNCTATASLIRSLDVTSFTIADLGANTVTLTVEDANGNIGTATAIVNVIDKLSQTIDFTAVTNKMYGASDFELQATSNAGLSVSYSVIDGPATINGPVVTITGIGSITLEASQAGDNDYAPANPVQHIIEVAKAPLTVEADNKTIVFGEALPTLTFSYSGFVNAESASSLSSVPAVSTTALASSDAGSYPINMTGGSADNYELSLADALLTISKASQSITADVITNKFNDDQPFDITATSTSGLDLTLAISGPASLQGNTVTLNETLGVVTITISQEGDVNYLAAESTVLSFEVLDVCASLVFSSTTISNANCSGTATGSIDISVMGGTAPYSYSWSDETSAEDLTGLAAGVYTVTVTDGKNCSISNQFTVSEPTLLQIASSSTSTSCFGAAAGSIDITVTGGTSPYSYEWSNDASTEDVAGLLAGIYTLVVTDDNNCTARVTVDVAEPTAINIVPSSLPVSCFGSATGSIDVSVSGGSPGEGGAYSYSWNNGATTQDLSDLLAGSYTLTVTDSNDCTSTVTVDVTEPTAINIVPSSLPASCFGSATGSIDVSVSGGSPGEGGAYSYSWNNGATTQDLSDLLTGSYTLVVTDDNNCTATVTVDVTEPTAIQITSTTTDVIDGNDGAADITVTGGTVIKGDYAYSWSNGETNQNLSGVIGGDYTVTVTDSNGCSESHTLTVGDIVLATEMDLDNSSFSYYPNPAKGYLTIEASFENARAVEVQLMDMSGRVLTVKKLSASDQLSTTMDVSNFKSGQYLLVLKTDNTQRVERITITH